MRYTAEDLKARYEEMTAVVSAHCTVVTEIVGGQPADENGVRAFVKHHLKVDGDEIEKATQRILHEEVGEHPIPSTEGELKEQQVYGVNAVRRTEFGPYLGNWMIKACLKQASSRLNIFSEIRGAKGDFAESGRVYAIGPSLVEQEYPDRIYLVSEDSTTPAPTYWHEFMGRVNTPQGSKSIIHHSECVAPGTKFSFELRFLNARVKESDVRDALALMMIVGLGSARSLERGKFRIDYCDIEMGEKPASRKPEKPAKNGVEVA